MCAYIQTQLENIKIETLNKKMEEIVNLQKSLHLKFL